MPGPGTAKMDKPAQARASKWSASVETDDLWADKRTVEGLIVLDGLGCAVGILNVLLHCLFNAFSLRSLAVLVVLVGHLLLLAHRPTTYLKFRSAIVVYHRLRFLAAFAAQVDKGTLQLFADNIDGSSDSVYLQFVALFTVWTSLTNNFLFLLPWRWHALLYAAVGVVQTRVVRQVVCSLQHVPVPPRVASAPPTTPADRATRARHSTHAPPSSSAGSPVLEAAS